MCNVCFRYGPSCQSCCVGSMCLCIAVLSPNPAIILGTIGSYLFCIGYPAICYSTNICFNCPEKKVTNQLIHSKQCSSCCIRFWKLCPPLIAHRLTHPSIDQTLCASRYTNLHELKSNIKKAQKTLTLAQQNIQQPQKENSLG